MPDAPQLVSPYLIDTPSPFATKATWRSFLREMASLPQDDYLVQQAVEDAKKALAR